MIKLSNVTKNYSNACVFNDFSLEIEEGKITCILGESGSGKTTLLNIISYFYRGRKKLVFKF